MHKCGWADTHYDDGANCAGEVELRSTLAGAEYLCEAHKAKQDQVDDTYLDGQLDDF
jgi:hypothetical protein